MRVKFTLFIAPRPACRDDSNSAAPVCPHDRDHQSVKITRCDPALFVRMALIGWGVYRGPAIKDSDCIVEIDTLLFKCQEVFRLIPFKLVCGRFWHGFLVLLPSP